MCGVGWGQWKIYSGLCDKGYIVVMRRAEAINFRAETELNQNFFNSFFHQVFIIISPVPWFQSILWSFIWTFVFLKGNNLIQMHNLLI